MGFYLQCNVLSVKKHLQCDDFVIGRTQKWKQLEELT